MVAVEEVGLGADRPGDGGLRLGGFRLWLGIAEGLGVPTGTLLAGKEAELEGATVGLAAATGSGVTLGAWPFNGATEPLNPRTSAADRARAAAERRNCRRPKVGLGLVQRRGFRRRRRSSLGRRSNRRRRLLLRTGCASAVGPPPSPI
jgi:hypothetical protein